MVKGQVVFSKRGRDKNKAFVVLEVADEYVFLADGQLRPLERVKKKKVKHVQIVNTVLALPEGFTNADIRKWLLPYKEVSDWPRTT